MTKKGRIFVAVVTLLIAIILVSSTIGREIYSGRTPGLGSFTLVHFAGYLFFLLMPVEALVPLYQAEGHSASTLVALAIGTALAAQAIDYGIGRLVSDAVIEDFVGEAKFARFKKTMHKWGSWAILFFNLFPLSSPNMLLVAGMSRYGVFRALAFSAAGLIVKYLGIVYVFDATGWLGGS